MFNPKPCLPVHIPRKRKRQAQSTSSVQVDTVGDGNLGDADAVVCNGNIDNDEDVYCNGEHDDLENETDAAASYLYSVREEARLLPDIWTTKALTITENGKMNAKTKNSVFSSKRAILPTYSSISSNVNHSATNLTSGSIISLQYLTSDRTKIYPPPTPYHIPQATKEWVDQTLADFSKLRLYLEHCKCVNDDRPSQRQPVPPMKDFMAWYTFCIGRRHGFTTGYTEVPSEEILSLRDTPTPAWEIMLPSNGNGSTPSVRLLLQMDQVMTRRVLLHLTSYVDHVSGDNRQSGCYLWIFALLARLEKPIHRDDAVTLFTLLKRLTLLRFQVPESSLLSYSVDTVSLVNHVLSIADHKINVDDEPLDSLNDHQYLATLNTLIVVIGVYFEQGGNYAQILEVPSPR
jgi:gem associated protein 2